MNKKWKKIIVGTTMITGVSLLLTACGSEKKAETKKDIPTLLMYEIGQRPKNFDTLLDKVNQTMEKEAGVKLNIQFVDYGDYKQKMSVVVSSGENYDIAFADNYVINAQKGAYADLTDLLPKYAKKTYDQLDPAYIEGNKVNGKLYALSVNGNVYSQQMLSFRKEILDKYNLTVDNIKTYADLEPLLKVVKENEPAVVPIATGPNYKVYENVDYIIDNNMPFVVRTSGDTSKIENIYNLPETKRDLKVMHDFYQKGYVAKDAATSTNTYPLGAKTWFVRAETQGPFDYGDTILTNAAGETILSVPITDPVKKSSNVRMANFVVSANSKYQKEAVKALDVLNTNSDVLNTLVYGIEGKSWEKDGEHSVKFLSGYQPETHLSGWNVGNNKAFYMPEGITEKQVKERDEGIEKATYSPILGFNFVPDKVKTEITNISNVMSKYQRGLNTGTLDPDKAIPQMNQELEKAGMDKVLTEMQTQYDHFLEEK
ncbi:ABC transporter substrate-binding protein [Enterococcus faecalis]|uniref:ABC transporter substrate-binding protein n=1 Tax=Enterococcus faecalis TaxID=1351 RepID=UPI0025B1544C|nr:ABC transporter substrate-binding protein [Enterococcus faecalis]MDN3128658.1 ABC transporter substrate-binding protein [Enterococcus faecalis]